MRQALARPTSPTEHGIARWRNIEEAKRGPIAWLGYASFRLLLGSFRLLPLPVAARLAGWLFLLVMWLLPRGRETRQRLLRRYGPEGKRIFRENAYNYGCMVAELAHRERLWRERTQRFSVENESLFAEALAAGPVVVLAAHMANWEMVMIAHVAQFGDASGQVPVKRIHNHYLNRWIDTFRRKIGVVPLEDRGSGTDLLRALKSGTPICFLADQNTPDTDAVWVPFLDERAATRVGPALLAIRGRARLIKLDFHRIRPGYFHLRYCHVTGQASNDLPLRTRLFLDAAMINRELGQLIDQYPSQWLWLHRRWKRQPPDDVEPWRTGQA